MSKRTNRKPDQVREKPFRLPKTRIPLKDIIPKNGATIKITGTNSAFIDDCKATLSNSYNIITESRIFFDIQRKEYHVYVTIQHYQRSS